MSHQPKQSYFFSQRRRVLVRRTRKHLDSLSVFGDKKEPVLSFRPKAIKEGDEGKQKSYPKRPASAVSRHSVQLPPVDATGPHLTTNNNTATQDQRKRRRSQVIKEEEKEEQEQQEEEELEVIRSNQPRYKFDELKIISAGILSNLTQRFKAIPEEINVPVSIAQLVTFTFYQLVIDTIVDKREWQTDAYLDYKPKEEKESSTKDIRLAKGIAKMSQGDIERPLTAKSTASGVSIKSDVSRDSSHEAAAEYDKLPPELRGPAHGPQILRYRRESQAPSRKILGPKTRLEKFQSMKKKAEKEKMLKKGKSRANLGLKELEKNEEKEIDISSIQSSLIKFSLGSKLCADQGWIVHPSQSQDPEGYTLNQWATAKLKEAMRQREEAKLTAKLRGEDGPLLVSYYSDSHSRSFRGPRHHHRTTSLPLPSVLSKLPPSLLGSAVSSETHPSPVFMSSDAPLALLQLPDGSGLCNYYSGNIAVSMSRKGDGSRGLYTLVFDNNDSHNLLAYFMPDGRAACYYRNGLIYMLTDAKGGKLLDEDGHLIRDWEWPVLPQRMSQSILLQLNTHIAVQITGRTQMTLKFSCHGQMLRFPVGLIPEALDQETRNESFWMKKSHIISDTLQTSLTFQSQAAKSASLSDTESIPVTLPMTASSAKPRSRGLATQESRRSLGGASKKGEELMESHSQSEWDRIGSGKELEDYRTKVSTIVNDWLGHYRQLLGIKARNNSINGLQSLSGSTHQLWSSLNLRSHPGSRPQTRLSTRRSTHHLLNLQSSSLTLLPCSSSLPLHVIESRSATPAPAPLSQSPAPVVGTSPTPNLPMSPFNDLIIERPKSQDQVQPFKVGRAKPKPRPPHSNKCGCPVALHEMIVRKLTEPPQCKCDRRRLPLIRDVEFDVFMSSHVPDEQIIVVVITHSKRSVICEPLLESINYTCNRNRSSPCHQSSGDLFRIFKYDLSKSIDDLNITGEGLLAKRHGIKVGMFLIYMGQQLLGGYTGFNGYGTTKRDFIKQIRESAEAGKRGHFLPVDFKFTDASIGSKIHSQSLWAYPVAGVLDEFVSVTPSSRSSSSSSFVQGLS
ncbi:PREDICTED: uncharacterized protein LOC109580711 [Amphimedon queenslandica]|uniref:FAM194 C-terminal domain-containing protein n=1 Tax=Amphimedon queenslandica TaxID=400682 RepID=A0AAN0IZ67_AMPQE|nr:PREDICTED: uncharacterized protein LOC109580711 [Amphimedon queenslandica]XP_019849748.1 PREDICTED: uncharacterized protein LOC109580711 [Amphimedon queenslandica]|eukprot:XP_019849747.1 PREDICTED: uncharacterized protein LOC109580711 [Amphimedon queenslandica]